MTEPGAPMDRTTYDGNTVNWRTRAMLETTAEKLGYDLTVTQGSYNAGGVGASAGTHDGGGAVDLSANDWKRKVRVLRSIGFAAWHRTEAQGDWPEHIHAIAMGDQEASAGAKAQMRDYTNHLNGLANHAPDNTWHPDPPVVFSYGEWKRGELREARYRAAVRKAINVLINARKKTDSKRTKATITDTIERLRKTQH